jgi:hypothetical protein
MNLAAALFWKDRTLNNQEHILLYREALHGFPTMLNREEAWSAATMAQAASIILSRRTFGPRVGRRQVV